MHGAIKRTEPVEPIRISRAQDEKDSEATASWRSLPEKPQLAILFFTRFFDFLHITSFQSYMFYQLKSFDSSLPDPEISRQAGILSGSFTAAQGLTAILWGKFADEPLVGRKTVILFGLFGTALSCVGLAFSERFVEVLVYRILGGIINGNAGISITMIAENVKDKAYQPLAFLILPSSFNLAALLGPILGGFMSDVVGTHPGIECLWRQRFPYAFPALTCAFFLFACAFGVFLILKETLSTYDTADDAGSRLGKFLRRMCNRTITQGQKYSLVSSEETCEMMTFSPDYLENQYSNVDYKVVSSPGSTKSLPWRHLWTKKVIYTLLMQAVFDLHMGAFTTVWVLYLCAPPIANSPRKDTGGLGMSAGQAGVATALVGAIAVPLQLFLYPAIHSHFGTIMSYRLFSALFPISYVLTPLLSFLHSASEHQAPGPLTWAYITFILFLHTMARIVSVPATIILLNRSSPHPSLLAAVNSIGQSVSAASRTLGPVLGSYCFAYGLENEMVGIVWWNLALVALIGTLLIR